MIRPACLLGFLFTLIMSLVPATSLAQAKPEKEIPTELKLPALFTDHMVLQQEVRVPIWGWAAPGATVKVSTGEKTVTATADKSGKWKASIGPLQAPGPIELSVTAGDKTIQLKDVLVGEVWLGSGQSNMQWETQNALNGEKEVQAANYPNIRLFTVPRHFNREPQSDLVEGAGWEPCSPESVRKFSAVAYFFGRELHGKLGVPIGLIESDWGGTPVEAWTSREALNKMPETAEAVRAMDALGTDEELLEKHREEVRKWQEKAFAMDPGYADGKPVWANAELDSSSWKEAEVPGMWDSYIEKFDGVVWYRREIDLPAEWEGKELKLSLGTIDDSDITWFNEQEVGRGDTFFARREYKVPANIARAGKNTITVRIRDDRGHGGFTGTATDLFIQPADGDSSVSLAGQWKWNKSITAKEMGDMPSSRVSAFRPTVLFNGMIHPVIPYAIKGVIWYQGENNAERAYLYRKQFPAMITDWRNRWDQGDFPFLFVQLANFRDTKPEPADDAWAELREAQLMTLKLPATAMASAIDIGEANDIHPRNKQDVGRRLSLCARAIAYGQEIEYMGPIYKPGSLKVSGNKATLQFTHTGDGMEVGGLELKGFAVAGKDRKFHWAEAKITASDTVEVSSNDVENPVAVRYAWAINPEANLYNMNGLPASPFRTDDWPGITEPGAKEK